MTAKQQAFCREYVVDCNATQAAIRAGYSLRSAGQQGERLLKKDETQQELARLRAISEEAAIASHVECCQALTEIVRASLSDLVDSTGQIDVEKLNALARGRALQELSEDVDPEGVVRRKIKLRDPVRAIEALAKLRGYNAPDKAEVDSTLTVNIKYAN